MPVAEELDMLRSQIAQLEEALAHALQPSAQVIPLVRPSMLAAGPSPTCESAMTPPRIAPPALPGESASAVQPQPAVTPQHQTPEHQDPQHIPLQNAESATTAAHVATETAAADLSVPVADSAAAAAPAAAPSDEPVSESSAFAAAWADDQSSFEERFAARQFFHDDGPQSPSRKWLLS